MGRLAKERDLLHRFVSTEELSRRLKGFQRMTFALWPENFQPNSLSLTVLGAAMEKDIPKDLFKP